MCGVGVHVRSYVCIRGERGSGRERERERELERERERDEEMGVCVA